ncbi:MAG: hypothetical protein NTY90_04225 [Candidatus Micrarchaeota archaeon]|nr:hypothetical protein [Candidatus Micrarchaeota archaeon]
MEEKSFFVKLFGDYPLIRVLDFLLTFREFDYALTEIAKNAGVGWSTIHTFWKDLVEMGIVRETRQVGRARLYKLNAESPLVKELIALYSKIISITSEKAAGPAEKKKAHASLAVA